MTDEEKQGAYLGRVLTCSDAKLKARAFKLVEIALTKHDGNAVRASRELGVSLTTLKNWLRDHARLGKHRDTLIAKRGLRVVKGEP